MSTHLAANPLPRDLWECIEYALNQRRGKPKDRTGWTWKHQDFDRLSYAQNPLLHGIYRTPPIKISYQTRHMPTYRAAKSACLGIFLHTPVRSSEAPDLESGGVVGKELGGRLMFAVDRPDTQRRSGAVQLILGAIGLCWWQCTPTIPLSDTNRGLPQVLTHEPCLCPTRLDQTNLVFW